MNVLYIEYILSIRNICYNERYERKSNTFQTLNFSILKPLFFYIFAEIQIKRIYKNIFLYKFNSKYTRDIFLLKIHIQTHSILNYGFKQFKNQLKQSPIDLKNFIYHNSKYNDEFDSHIAFEIITENVQWSIEFQFKHFSIRLAFLLFSSFPLNGFLYCANGRVNDTQINK